MSARDEYQVEAKSSIKVTRNSKGEAQFEAKVVSGATDEELETLRRQAVAQYRELARELA